MIHFKQLCHEFNLWRQIITTLFPCFVMQDLFLIHNNILSKVYKKSPVHLWTKTEIIYLEKLTLAFTDSSEKTLLNLQLSRKSLSKIGKNFDIETIKMTLLSSKSGSQPETFGALKQKLGKQHSWGFKQHFTSTSTNQDMKTMDKKDKKFLRTCSQETVQSKEENRNVDEKRGFVPSDVNDPTKREFLSQLSKRIFTEQRRQNLFSKLRVLIQEIRKITICFFFPIFCMVYM